MGAIITTLRFTLLAPFAIVGWVLFLLSEFFEWIVTLGTLKYYPVYKTGGIVITGCSTGIGRHAALHLCKRGYVVYAGVRKEVDGESLRQEARSDRMIPVICDVAKADTVASALTTVTASLRERNIPLVALVNNAGVMVVSPFELCTAETFEWVYQVNVFGVVRMTQAFLPLLRQSKGRIVNVSSIMSYVSLPLFTPYNSSKFALRCISDGMRQELADFGIGVTSVEPGATKTPIFTKSDEDDIRNMKKGADPQILGLYRDTVIETKTSVAWVENMLGGTVKGTTSAITNAITDRFPDTHRLVGLDAPMMMFWNRLLPPRLLDAFTRANYSAMGFLFVSKQQKAQVAALYDDGLSVNYGGTAGESDVEAPLLR